MQNEKALFQTGAGIDFRTEDQKMKDYDPREAFASGVPIVWKEKTIEEIEAEIKASSISQGQTLRCVSEYAGIALEWAEFLESQVRLPFSRRDVYDRRFNRPEGGMAMWDLFAIMREGACLESQLPSTAATESEINQPYDVTDDMRMARAKYASGASFMWKSWTIDDLAMMIQSGIPVCLFWFFDNTTYDEWWNQYPKVIDKNLTVSGDKTGRHQAAGVVFCLFEGKKHIVVMDSAGQGFGAGTQKNLRFVSEDFIKLRSYGAGFAIDKKNLDHVPDPGFKYDFSRNLKYGDTGPDVQALQTILVLEGCMKIKTPTENYLGMTQAAVKKLQEKYKKEILDKVFLNKGTGIFGTWTRAFVNDKYGTKHNPIV